MALSSIINRLKHLHGIHFLAGVLLLNLSVNGLQAQTTATLNLTIKPLFSKQALILNDSTYTLPNGNTLVFETLKFYMSGLQLYQNDSLVYSEQAGYHLYDASEPLSQRIHLKLPLNCSYNILTFNLGIDSTINVSGAMGGDLDPTKGMYWAWQSGYINVKLEGKSSLSTHPKQEFQFHLGGYQNPFNALKTITVKVSQKENMELLFDVSRFMESVNLLKYHHVMSPGEEGLRLSSAAAPCFTMTP